jgi:hypothetical protein
MILIAVGSLVATAARAGVVDPSRSTVPGRIFLCPAGDSSYVVVTRHISGSPWAEDSIRVDLCGCPQVRLCRAGLSGYTVDAAGCDATAFPDRWTGVSSFALAGGGLCPGGSVVVSAGFEALATGIVVVSPDQNGDLIVDGLDLAIEREKVGTADASGDLDGDGIVTEADVALLTRHLGHAGADRPTPTLPVTWGRVKQIYR